jgi:DNA-binding NtrC family response regulator
MMKTMKILMIEDVETDFQLVARYIRKSGLNAEITRVQDIDELKDAIVKGGWDVVLSDYKVVGLDFQESLDILINNLVGIPVIMVSGSVGEETAVDLLKKGLCDFVLKDRLQRLVPAIERSLKEHREKRRREKAEHDLKESDSRFRTYVESSPMGIIVADGKGRFIDVNPTVEHLLGYDHETLDRKSVV